MAVNPSEYFGCKVFSQKIMQEKLPKVTYKALMRTLQQGEPLDIEVANVVAHAMKDWAVEKGVTSGMSATTFAPNSNCTRAQIVTFLYRAASAK